MFASFAGPRPQKIGGFQIPNPTYTKIRNALKNKILELKPEKCISGMALGVDQMAAELCIELEIPFIAAVPFVGQESVWPEASKLKYKNILDNAQEVKIVSEGGYASWKLQKRNEWMVDNSDILIAVWNEGYVGGTTNCVNYAKSVGKKLALIEY